MTKVVSCLLVNNEGKLLILKRSDKVKTYKGCWSGVAGYVEENEEPFDTAFKEIHEETGLKKDNISFVKKGDLLACTDFYDGKQYYWLIFPFLFKLGKKSKIHIDWEHVDYKWIKPSEISEYDTVPNFKDIVSKMLL